MCQKYKHLITQPSQLALSEAKSEVTFSSLVRAYCDGCEIVGSNPTLGSIGFAQKL